MSDTDRVVANLVRQVGATTLPLVNPGNRVEVRHPLLSEVATGLVVGGAYGSDLVLVKLDGTHQLVNVPITYLRRVPW